MSDESSANALLEKTRRALLAGHDIWYCTTCAVGVPSLLSPCGSCHKTISFVPLEWEEFEVFVRAQRERGKIDGVSGEQASHEASAEDGASSSSDEASTSSSETAGEEAGQTFVLYDEEDDDNVCALHNVVRREIWEGFVVSSSDGSTDEDDSGSPNRRLSGRLARYEGTVGFRCRWCKDAPANARAEKAAVYPRSLERIYLANLRFQRDHVEHCTFIPKAIKKKYFRLKNSKNMPKGKKPYWVTSALQKGLCNGENGIVFASVGAKK